MSCPDYFSDYVGVPFAEKGRDIEAGVDCWGLVSHIWREHYGIDVPLYTEKYDDLSQNNRLQKAISEGIDQNWKKIEDEADYQHGDGIVFRLWGNPTHIGMLIDAGKRFIHIMEGIDATVSELTEKRWEKRIIGVYRHEDMV